MDQGWPDPGQRRAKTSQGPKDQWDPHYHRLSWVASQHGKSISGTLKLSGVEKVSYSLEYVGSKFFVTPTFGNPQKLGTFELHQNQKQRFAYNIFENAGTMYFCVVTSFSTNRKVIRKFREAYQYLSSTIFLRRQAHTLWWGTNCSSKVFNNMPRFFLHDLVLTSSSSLDFSSILLSH